MKRLLQFSALAAVASMYSVYSTVLLWLAFSIIFLAAALFTGFCWMVGHVAALVLDWSADWLARAREGFESVEEKA